MWRYEPKQWLDRDVERERKLSCVEHSTLGNEGTSAEIELKIEPAVISKQEDSIDTTRIGATTFLQKGINDSLVLAINYTRTEHGRASH